MKVMRIITICLLLQLISCDKNSTQPVEDKSVIGKIVDQASGEGVGNALVKIISSKNAYQTTTNTNGSFAFSDINSGTYLMYTEVVQEGKVLIDTCGEFNTDTPDWGNIYARIFASVFGTIQLEDADDNSLVMVQLLGTDKSALTTNRGKFRIDFILPGMYDLYFTKDGYKEIQILDIIINQGDTINVDTTLFLKYKPLTLQLVTGLDSLNTKASGFCYANDYFWYTNWKGLLKYDLINNIEEQVYVLINCDWASTIHYLMEPYVTYDYDDGIWLSGDEPMTWYYRKYSVSENRIVDSIGVSTLPSHNYFRFAFDRFSNSLVLFDSYTKFYPIIHKYSLISGAITSVNMELSEYNFNEYKGICIEQIFIDPEGKVYFILKAEDLTSKKELHLYICNNINDLELEKIYKFPDTYTYANRISWYNNELYTVNKGLLYKIIL